MAVRDDDTALRRVPPLLVVSDPKIPGGRRASSAAFTDDADGSSMSSYLQSIVEQLGYRAETVVYGKATGWAVAAMSVAMLVGEEQQIVADPVIDAPDPHPCDPAHALVHGEKKPKSRRERIAARSPLVHLVA